MPFGGLHKQNYATAGNEEKLTHVRGLVVRERDSNQLDCSDLAQARRNRGGGECLGEGSEKSPKSGSKTI